MAIDWDFIESLEGFATVGYVPVDSDGEPLGKSGVTISAGVDLRHWDEEKLRRRAVPEDIIEKVRPYLRMSGRDALFIANQLELTENEARMLGVCVRSAIVSSLTGHFNRRSRHFRFKDLPQPVQTVIASVAFQYGPALHSRTPNFFRQITAGDWGDAYKNLINFGDAYPTRRRKEGAYLKTALANPPERS